jgi:hypothetical protein
MFARKLWHCPTHPDCLAWSHDGTLALAAAECLYIITPELTKASGVLDIQYAEISYRPPVDARSSAGSGAGEDEFVQPNENSLPLIPEDRSDFTHWLDKSASYPPDPRVEVCCICWSPIKCTANKPFRLIAATFSNGECLVLMIMPHSAGKDYSFRGRSDICLALKGVDVYADVGKSFQIWRHKSAAPPTSSLSHATASSSGTNCCGESVRCFVWLPEPVCYGGAKEEYLAFAVASGCMISIWALSNSQDRSLLCVSSICTCDISACHFSPGVNECCYEHSVQAISATSSNDQRIIIVYSTVQGVIGRMDVRADDSSLISSVWQKTLPSVSLSSTSVVCNVFLDIVVVVGSFMLHIIGLSDADILTIGKNYTAVSLPNIIFDLELCWCDEIEGRSEYLVRCLDSRAHVLSLAKDDQESLFDAHFQMRDREHGVMLNGWLDADADIPGISGLRSESATMIAKMSNSTNVEVPGDAMLFGSCSDPLRFVSATVSIIPGSVASSRDDQLNVSAQRSHCLFNVESLQSASTKFSDLLSAKWIMDDAEVRIFVDHLIYVADCTDWRSLATLGLASVSMCFLLSVETCQAHTAGYVATPLNDTQKLTEKGLEEGTEESILLADLQNSDQVRDSSDLVTAAAEPFRGKRPVFNDSDAKSPSQPFKKLRGRKISRHRFMRKALTSIREKQKGAALVVDSLGAILATAKEMLITENGQPELAWRSVGADDNTQRKRKLLVQRAILQLLLVPNVLVWHNFKSSGQLQTETDKDISGSVLPAFNAEYDILRETILLDVITYSIDRWNTHI